jgi:hypothetical protein
MALGEFLGKACFVFSVLIAAQAGAMTVEKIDFADQLDVAGHKLVLNGAGLRIKRKFGIGFRVYVAGLYVVQKSSDAKALIASDEPKYLRMVFLRGLGKDTLQEAMEESFKKSCKFECENQTANLKTFLDLMVAVKENSEIKFAFDKESASVEVSGKETRSGKIAGPAFSKNLLAMFIGDEPPTEEFKSALLGK